MTSKRTEQACTAITTDRTLSGGTAVFSFFFVFFFFFFFFFFFSHFNIAAARVRKRVNHMTSKRTEQACTAITTDRTLSGGTAVFSFFVFFFLAFQYRSLAHLHFRYSPASGYLKSCVLFIQNGVTLKS